MDLSAVQKTVKEVIGGNDVCNNILSAIAGSLKPSVEELKERLKEKKDEKREAGKAKNQPQRHSGDVSSDDYYTVVFAKMVTWFHDSNLRGQSLVDSYVTITREDPSKKISVTGLENFLKVVKKNMEQNEVENHATKLIGLIEHDKNFVVDLKELLALSAKQDSLLDRLNTPVGKEVVISEEKDRKEAGKNSERMLLAHNRCIASIISNIEKCNGHFTLTYKRETGTYFVFPILLMRLLTFDTLFRQQIKRDCPVFFFNQKRTNGERNYMFFLLSHVENNKLLKWYEEIEDGLKDMKAAAKKSGLERVFEKLNVV